MSRRTTPLTNKNDHLTTDGNNGLKIIGALREFRGFGFGLRDPAIIMKFEGQPIDADTALKVWQSCVKAMPELGSAAIPVLVSPSSLPTTTSWMLEVIFAIQLAKGQAIHSPGHVIVHRQGERVSILVPAQHSAFGSTKLFLKALIALINDHKRGVKPQTSTTIVFGHAIDALGQLRSTSSNVERFFNASREMDLPFFELPTGLMQIGLGVHARWLKSSVTDVTPNVGVALARNKIQSLSLLRDAGLPTTVQAIAHSEQDAITIANKLGFPVVVKPNDQDGGIGVAAGLQTIQELQSAFSAARAHSKNILVEKHYDGRDYRLTVFQGRLIWAIERVAAGVEGDGCSTVQELIDAVNLDPRRAQVAHAPLKPIITDDEVVSVLAEQKKDLAWVVPKGVYVRLKRVSNIATGGYPIGVKALVHPDNVALAIRAAQALRLDLAGIDLLIPDISVSWHSSGAAICEINAQPTLGQTTAAHLYREILEVLVPGTGRVPTVLVLGSADNGALAEAIAERFAIDGLKVGIHTRDKTVIGDELMSTKNLDVRQAGRLMALNRDVEAIVLSADDAASLQSGLGIARIDAVVLAHDWNVDVRTHCGKTRAAIPNDTAQLALMSCDGVIFDVSDRASINPDLANTSPANWIKWRKTPQELAVALCAEVLAIASTADRAARQYQLDR